MIEDAVDFVVAEVRKVGLRATSDPRDLHLPGVLVGFSGLTRQLDGSAVVRVRLLAVAPDRGDPLPDLDRLLAGLDSMGLGDVEAVSVTLGNHAPNPLPALETFTTVRSEP